MPKLPEEDVLSEASFGSVISLRSVGSDDGYTPKPPSGTRKSQSGGKRASKVKKQDSPYIGKNAAPKKTGRELWVASIRQGTGMSAESSGMNTMNGMKSPYTGQSKAKASTSSYLLDQLLMATGQPPKNHSRSSSYTNAHVGGNGPAYKTAEEYYDEVLELKKRINQLMKENEMIKSKMHKVEGDNFAKSRQIDELINPNMQSNEIRRTLTNKKPDANAVVTSLKHKLHSMERMVKSKDSELSKLRDDIKYTDLAELQIQNEVYYQEIQRLTMMLTEPRSSNTLHITSEIKKEKTPEGKLKKYGEAVESLSDDNNRLTLENRCLKEDLKKAMDLNSQTLNLSKDVEDMNRIELLAKISQLEQQIREDDGKETETPRSKKSPLQSRRFPGKAGEEVKRLEERETELMDELEKQKSTIKKLKEDRTHYRKLADEYRLQLEKIKSGTTVDGTKSSKEELEKPRSESVVSSSSVRKSLKKKSSSSSNGKKENDSDRKENDAAKTIQRNWRNHRIEKLKMEDERFNESVSTIQAAFRGHAARERLLRTRRIATLSDDDEVDNTSDVSSLYEDDVMLMQAAFRGHLSRRDFLDRKNRLDNEESDEDFMAERYRPRRSFDTGDMREPVMDRFGPRTSSSKRRNIYQTEDFTTRSSIERRDLSQRKSSAQRYDSPQQYQSVVQNNDTDDDDDDDVVIGSSSSLNSDSRFEQSYLSKYKTGSSQNVRKSQMSRIQEEEHGLGYSSSKNASNKFQQSSTSWGSMRKTNITDFLSDSEEEDRITSSSQRNKNIRMSSKSKTDEKDHNSRKRESVRLANKWATSGSQNSKTTKKQEKSLITARPTSSPWQKISNGNNQGGKHDDDDDDDDDDLVIGPAISRQRRQALEDELM